MKIKKIENFKEMSKKQKRRSLIISSILFLIGVGIIVSFCFYEKIYGADSIFQKDYFNNQILNGIVHIVPSILNTLTIVVICYFLNKLLKWILTKCFAKTNRGITILRLLHSFLRWMIVIIAAFAILSTLGVNTSTLLASAGVLTLVIGLGAQSLVADVVAGLFIVIEGEYLVGDIVVIDGWRGTVKEIGIRTTKVEDAGGNLLIINNSEIKSLINQTTELSVAKCVMSVDYSEDIERVEEVIKSNLEEIGKNIPGIIEGPFYKGINELADSSVDVLMVAKCKEEDIYQVQRDMTKQFYLLFNKNNINIPYNQIVVTNSENIKKK
jgi:mscS mechanosensitive ion channel